MQIDCNARQPGDGGRRGEHGGRVDGGGGRGREEECVNARCRRSLYATRTRIHIYTRAEYKARTRAR